MVLDGSFPLWDEFFAAHDDGSVEWPKIDSFHHTKEQLQWFYDRGCTWKKSELPSVQDCKAPSLNLL